MNLRKNLYLTCGTVVFLGVFNTTALAEAIQGEEVYGAADTKTKTFPSAPSKNDSNTQPVSPPREASLENPSMPAKEENQPKEADDIKVEDNKLVESGEVTHSSQKMNGFVWFGGVFLVLLVVVFAFT